MADQIKKVQITGGAAETYLAGTKTRKKARTQVPRQVTRESQKGGDSTGALVQLSASHVPKMSIAPPSSDPIGVASSIIKSNPSPILMGGSTAPAAAAKPTEKSVKVVLAPKKKTQKVVLTPAKKVVKLLPAPSMSSPAPMKKSRGKTLKVARRIRVSVEGLNKKINRAKTIKKESQTLTIEKIKSELTAAGLIKNESKAPDAILRQMYTDFQLLKQRAL
jgi:hypothetical protein